MPAHGTREGTALNPGWRSSPSDSGVAGGRRLTGVREDKGGQTLIAEPVTTKSLWRPVRDEVQVTEPGI